MAKPSGTNHPKTFRVTHTLSCVSDPESSRARRDRDPGKAGPSRQALERNPNPWWLQSGCAPLPIPNREVKPRIADDTALVRGKVGRRHTRSAARHRAALLLFFVPPHRLPQSATGIRGLYRLIYPSIHIHAQKMRWIWVCGRKGVSMDNDSLFLQLARYFKSRAAERFHIYKSVWFQTASLFA